MHCHVVFVLHVSDSEDRDTLVRYLDILDIIYHALKISERGDLRRPLCIGRVATHLVFLRQALGIDSLIDSYFDSTRKKIERHSSCIERTTISRQVECRTMRLVK